MAMRLENKTVLVTAAGQGIGRAIALAAAAEGARVLATDIAPQKLQHIGNGIESYNLDVTQEPAIRAFAEKVGLVDVLCNVAGFVHHGTVLEATEAELDFAFDLNVKSMFRTIRAFLPGMMAAGRGSIVNMASVASNLKGVPFRAVYATTKAAVIGLTRAVAADAIASGVRCNAIAPGTVQSPSLDDRIAAFDDPAQARRDFI
ncbi:MAG: SDR family NAD(P)-dependent oxidoreductase, partial [Alphaproteobacteria bacterium]|nr:SDR family NAD(P)-dependent oxidoreductase [Alphaproteobacteria bacterium]